MKDRGKSKETVGSSVFVAREAASRVRTMMRKRGKAAEQRRDARGDGGSRSA